MTNKKSGPNSAQPLLLVDGVKKYFPLQKGLMRKTYNYVRAVDGVSFSVEEGETFGLVGESGCGKSTLGMLICGLDEPTEGTIHFDGTKLTSKSWYQEKHLRTDIQMIFQDPYSSLNPRYTIGEILREPLLVHRMVEKNQIGFRLKQLMESVNLPASYLNKYPAQLSGGERQRVGIARALTVNPRLIICDEPVSALDVSMQAQVLNLICDLQTQYHLTFLFVAHGLGSVLYVSSRVAVMYLGTIMEIGNADDIFSHAVHPYTRLLLDAYPVPNPELRTAGRTVTFGEVPSPSEKNDGCKFLLRCPFASEQCRISRPPLRGAQGSMSHLCACYHTS